MEHIASFRREKWKISLKMKRFVQWRGKGRVDGEDGWRRERERGGEREREKEREREHQPKRNYAHLVYTLSICKEYGDFYCLF